MQIEDIGRRDKPEVSIIVPVYNVEKYLRQSLDSILAQTFTDWECVVVNDGSTDNSGSICNEYAGKDSRFKVVHTPNGGVAEARNVAISASKGRLIAFCDPDDWMEPQMIEVLYRLIVDNDADVAQVGFWKEFEGYRHNKHLVREKAYFNNNEAILRLLSGNEIPSYLWNKMFKREIVSSEFPKGMLFEDIYTCTKWFTRVKTMVCVPDLLYHYRMRTGSIVHSLSPKYRLDYIKAECFRADEVLKLGLDSFKATDHDMLVIKACVRGAKIIARNERDKDRRYAVLQEVSEKLKSVKSLPVKISGPKLWFRSRLLSASPRAFSRLMRIVGKADLHSSYRLRGLYD